MPREFIYSYGQLGDDVLAATNTGGVYRFDGREWKCLVEPIEDVSYQVYTMINYYDRLLLGQYPTGNLFEYDGREVRHLQDQPPVMPGVSDRAREAQTTAIYGGDLYVGVWPWAELWRLDGNSHMAIQPAACSRIRRSPTPRYIPTSHRRRNWATCSIAGDTASPV